MMEIDVMAKQKSARQRSAARLKSSSKGGARQKRPTARAKVDVKRPEPSNERRLEGKYPDERWTTPLIVEEGTLRALMCRYCMATHWVRDILKSGDVPLDEASFIRHLREVHNRQPDPQVSI
jgi:hypothetical protein